MRRRHQVLRTRGERAIRQSGFLRNTASKEVTEKRVNNELIDAPAVILERINRPCISRFDQLIGSIHREWTRTLLLPKIRVRNVVLSKRCYEFADTEPSQAGANCVKNLLELRAKAALCRQLAVREPANRAHWLAEAERWLRLEQDEISAHFVECNVIQPTGRAA